MDLIKWRYFWIAIAVLMGCSNVRRIAKFVGTPLIPELSTITLLGILLPGLFILYFIGEKTGLSEHIRQNL